MVPYPAHAVLGFPGQFANSQQLAGAQHYYNRYRDYDVNTGRYIQADPIGLAGDDNPYAYARGNPLRYMDPDGLQRSPPMRRGPTRAPPISEYTSPVRPAGGIVYSPHAMQQHVGRSPQQLSARLRANPWMDAASSFTSPQAAQTAINKVVAANSARIQQWLNQGLPVGAQLPIHSPPNICPNYANGLVITPSRGLMSGGLGNIQPAAGVTVVLMRTQPDFHNPTGFIVYTAYPTAR